MQKQNVPLSAAQAMACLTLTLSRTLEYRGKTRKMIDDAQQAWSLDQQSSPERRKYIGYLHDIQRKCGPECATLCAISLGQTKIAHMSRANLDSLLSLLQTNVDMVISNRRLKRIIPEEWKNHNAPPRPAMRSSDGYYKYNFISNCNMHRIPDYLSTSLLQHWQDSPIRALESKQSLLGTESIELRLPRTAEEDIFLFVEIGSAQAVIKELALKQVDSRCCK
jgi:hypothetical protein